MEKRKLANLKSVRWQFNDICAIAKELKPANWIAVATKQRLSFMEVELGQHGPAQIQRQLVISSLMNIEAYVNDQKLSDEPFPISLNYIHSATDLAMVLRIFTNYGICLGNRNFKRIQRSELSNASEYWKHGQCQLLYQPDSDRPERCCDMCLSLNACLPKKINNQRLMLRREPDDNQWTLPKKINNQQLMLRREPDDNQWTLPHIKRFKVEEPPVRIVIKEEPLH